MKNIKQLERWAWLLDNSIRIPGTSIKMGLDSLIGLIPGIGDITGGALSSYLLLQAVGTGVAPVVIARMAVNIVLDTLIGMIPLVGDIFDIAFKANQRNIELMTNYHNSPRQAVKRNTISILIISISLISALALIIWIAIKIFVWLINAIN
jgi:predicted aconitase with swiveling domain